MISKNRFSVANVVNWNRPKWRELETARSSRWCVAVLRSDATILVHAAPEKSTRSAAARTPSQLIAHPGNAAVLTLGFSNRHCVSHPLPVSDSTYRNGTKGMYAGTLRL